ncbi:hypothetical protein HMPREF1986_00676 [Oribacterium sp. oral taxon 078 str. F0263]|nr:hypothetical protein HMPREF1986_00676 [Oribacterium sp. oral taxon 078 str. F0263]
MLLCRFGRGSRGESVLCRAGKAAENVLLRSVPKTGTMIKDKYT